MGEALWVEEYRPNKIGDCILPKGLKKSFTEIVSSGKVPNMLLSGTAGTGKTTIAKALCHELGLEYIMVNCSEDSGIDTLRNRIRQFASSISLTGNDSLKVVILDEFDYANCLEENEKIKLSDGSYIKLSDMEPDKTYDIISFNPETEEFQNDTANVIMTSEKEVFEVELEDGRTISVTEDHPFMVRFKDGTIGQRSIAEGLDGMEIILE